MWSQTQGTIKIIFTSTLIFLCHICHWYLVFWHVIAPHIPQLLVSIFSHLLLILRIFICKLLQYHFLICLFNNFDWVMSAHLELHSSSPCFNRRLQRVLLSGFRFIYMEPRMPELAAGKRISECCLDFQLSFCKFALVIAIALCFSGFILICRVAFVYDIPSSWKLQSLKPLRLVWLPVSMMTSNKPHFPSIYALVHPLPRWPMCNQ